MNYRVGVIPLDVSIYSKETNQFMESIINVKNRKILETRFVKMFSHALWKQATPYLWILFFVYWLFNFNLTLLILFLHDPSLGLDDEDLHAYLWFSLFILSLVA